ncbi:MAG: 16S rRNA (uracil(1498)-N(3))-methyltransferase [Clostridiales bacterium]|nr:16S rRNA (uracil(1498)-N(3))-methyltransferase [Clostridiales bacterium]
MRFFLPSDKIKGAQARIEGADAHHIANVLRIQPGELLEIASLGRLYEARVVKADSENVSLVIEREVEKNMESPLQVWLLLGLTKGEKMDLAVEKATELGAGHIVPVACRRSVARPDENQARAKTERWQRVAEAAAKQCRRAVIPRVLPLCSLSEALRLLPPGCALLAPWEDEHGLSFAKALAAFSENGKPEAAALFIGPEGGLEKEEAELCRSCGGLTFSMGPRILRSETAALAALSVLMYIWGDMGGRGDE